MQPTSSAPDSSPLSRTAIDLLINVRNRVLNPSAYLRLLDRLPDTDRPLVRDRVDNYVMRLGGVDTIGLWADAFCTTPEEATVEVGQRTGFLTSDNAEFLRRELGVTSLSVDDWAQRRRLVIDGRQRILYWDGERVDLDWRGRSVWWSIIGEFVRDVVDGGTGIESTIFGRPGTDYLSKEVSRLKNADGFPLGLADLIVNNGTGIKRLDLQGDEIHVHGSVDLL